MIRTEKQAEVFAEAMVSSGLWSQGVADRFVCRYVNPEQSEVWTLESREGAIVVYIGKERQTGTLFETRDGDFFESLRRMFPNSPKKRVRCRLSVITDED